MKQARRKGAIADRRHFLTPWETNGVILLEGDHLTAIITLADIPKYSVWFEYSMHNEKW
ncbi:MAG: hypothetical protein HXX11_04275 [Desulfuromonadales bacterium]|nr:hypothetical protein [Desulfuromonadales bacterium]